MSAAVEMRVVQMPLVRPFRTSKGEERVREALMMRWIDEDGFEGWSECAADPEPTYFPEYINGVRRFVTEILLPLVKRMPTSEGVTVGSFRAATRDIPRNPLALSLVESAVLDMSLRRRSMGLTEYLGGVRRPIDVGVSVGIPADLDTLVGWVGGYLDDGYHRVKLKIQPGWDVEPVRAIRREFGDDLALQVDANQAYTMADVPSLRRLDDFGLLLIEQPLAQTELVAHARLAADLVTPICLDESIQSLSDAATALALGAADVVNIKPSRVGGYSTARQIHDLCLAHGVPVFCGGTLETGVGRAANLALATLPGFTLPGDISATSRYYARDICQPFELRDGTLIAPDGPGTGAVIDMEAVEDLTIVLDRCQI